MIVLKKNDPQEQNDTFGDDVEKAIVLLKILTNSDGGSLSYSSDLWKSTLVSDYNIQYDVASEAVRQF